MAKKFLPPYGDGTQLQPRNDYPWKFSPPYGDGTELL